MKISQNISGLYQQNYNAQFNQVEDSRNTEVAQNKSDELSFTATPNITSSSTDISPLSKHEPYNQQRKVIIMQQHQMLLVK